MSLIVGGFRFLDLSGCEVSHSPRRRQDLEVHAAEAQEKGTAAHEPRARRGHAKVVLGDGQERWAKRKDEPVFAEAEAVIRQAQVACRAVLAAISVRVGNARAVPRPCYERFEEARQRCQAIAREANDLDQVKEANRLLQERGERGRLSIVYDVGLHPELRLADPEDARRAERLQRSIAEAISLVLRAVRSGDREQIRQALESAGALAEGCADPDLRGEVERVLLLAQETTRALVEQARAQSAAARASREQVRLATADRVQRADAEMQRIQSAAQQAQQVLRDRFEILDLQDDSDLAESLTYEEAQRRFRERRAAQEQQEAADRRGSLLEVAGERRRSTEEEAEMVAAQLDLEQEQRQRPGRVLDIE